MIARALAALTLLAIALALAILTLSSLLGGCTADRPAPAPDAGMFCASRFPHHGCPDAATP